jgi:hypothetical protein
MRYVASIIAGVITYAIALALMAELLHVREDSSWYWLPFAASVVAVVVAVRPWRADVGGKRGYAVAATAGSVFVVLAVDLFGAVWYSCVKGVCI